MNFLRTVAHTFYAADLYGAARQESGHRIGYSFLLVAVCMAVWTSVAAYQLYSRVFASPEGAPSALELVVNQIAAQWPAMTYSDGKLVTREATPTVITLTWNDGRSSMAIATIDTSGTANHKTTTTPLLITHEEVYMTTRKKTEMHTIREIAGGATQTLVITPSLTRDLADGFVGYVNRNLLAGFMLLGTVTWLLLTAVFFVARLVLLAGLSVAGALVARVLKVALDFAALMRLAALSFTPVAISETIYFALTLKTLSPPWACCLGLVMLGAAILTVRNDVGQAR